MCLKATPVLELLILALKEEYLRFYQRKIAKNNFYMELFKKIPIDTGMVVIVSVFGRPEIVVSSIIYCVTGDQVSRKNKS